MPYGDPRIPIRFGAFSDAGPQVALLIEGDAPAPPGITCARFALRPSFHPGGCTCCAPRGAAAEALTRLFLAGVRGWTGLFRSVVAVTASENGRQAVRSALAADAVSSGRFRLE